MDAKRLNETTRIEKTMILKGSTRGGARQMAQHLLSDENDHVTVHAVDGFMADDVEGALQEIYAISRGTQCQKFMFSLSLSPPEEADITSRDFDDAIAQAEEKLGLQGQPKVVVFHEKGLNRNPHAHCIWSRIDTDNMKAIEQGLYKKKLNELAKDLYIQHSWKMPSGFIGRDNADPRNFNLKEWKQAERQGLNPQQVKATLQKCWQYSDNQKSFSAALAQSGFFLACGDEKNVHLAVNWSGEIYTLRRSLNIKVKALKDKIGEADKLPKVEAIKGIIGKANTEAHVKLKDQLALQHKYEIKPIAKRRRELLKDQRIERTKQHKAHERRQQQERDERQKQYRRGFKGLFDLVTGRYRTLKRTHEVRQLAADNRDRDEKDQLIKSQLLARQAIDTQMDIIKDRRQREVMKLNADFVKDVKGQAIAGEVSEGFKHTAKPQQAPTPQRPELNL
jgi:hypothetical protein